MKTATFSFPQPACHLIPLIFFIFAVLHILHVLQFSPTLLAICVIALITILGNVGMYALILTNAKFRLQVHFERIWGSYC